MISKNKSIIITLLKYLLRFCLQNTLLSQLKGFQSIKFGNYKEVL